MAWRSNTIAPTDEFLDTSAQDYGSVNVIAVVDTSSAIEIWL